MGRAEQVKETYTFNIDGQDKQLDIGSVYCIGYAGRDQAKVQEHIAELAELGVPKPDEIPTLYPVSVSRLNQKGAIEVLGQKTSGEAEIVLLFGQSEDELYITTGSDHTDRALETVGINLSKQVCDKPIASKAWSWAKVKDHWDQLKLISQVWLDRNWENYQEQEVSAILAVEDLITYLKKKNVELTHCLVFGGTVPLLDGFKYGQGYRIKLQDPVLGDSIVCEYYVHNIES